MKKLIRLSGILAVLILALAITAVAAESGTCGDNLTWSLQDGVLTISGTGKMNDYPSIGDAPWYSLGVTSVVVQEGVTYIGEGAFWCCRGITGFSLPDSLTEIGEVAFGGLDKLKSITLPKGLKKLGFDAFLSCGALESITIPDSVETIDAFCFTNCKSLTQVTLPAGLTKIPQGLFSNCTGLQSVTVGGRVSSVGAEPFRGCDALTKIRISKCSAKAIEWLNQNGYFSKTAQLPHEGQMEKHAGTAATCEEEGTKDCWECSVCHNLYSDEEGNTHIEKAAAVPALGHDWGSISYKWADDHSTVTASAICKRDAKHTLEETAEATITSWYTYATCEETGSGRYTAKFENSCFRDQSVTAEIPAKGHLWGEAYYDWSGDYSTVNGFARCTRDSSHKAVEDVQTEAETILEPTCTENGRIRYTARFTSEAFTEQTEEDIIPAPGHDWGKAKYEWSKDCKTVTASAICKRDGSHEQKETAQAEAEVIRTPTCTKDGETRYTAEFINGLFAKQTKKVKDIPALGHQWGKTVYTWSPDKTSVTASHVCERDEKHTETETRETVLTVKKEPTLTRKGKGILSTRAFTVKEFKKQKKTVTIPLLTIAEYGGARYRLNGKKTVVCIGLSGSAGKTLEIPDAITVGKDKYPVTEIGGGAFKDAAGLAEIRIGKNVQKIGAGAFSGCSGTKTIVIQTEKLKDETVGDGAFGGIGKKTVVKCPKGKKKAYGKLLKKKGAPKTVKYK